MPDQPQDSFFQEVDPNAGSQFFQEVTTNTQDPQGQPVDSQNGRIPDVPVDSITNGVADGQQAQVTPEDKGPQPRELPEHLSPEHAYGMATYQQSRADKALAEISRLKEEMEALQTANPIAAYVARDPAILQQVLSSINGGSTSNGQPIGAALAGGNQQAPIQKPEPPQRPANMEPYSDETIAYHNALIDYQSQLAEYNQSMFDAQVARLQQAEQQRTQEMQFQQQLSQTKQEAMYQYGLTAQEADEFIRFASDPSSTSDMGLWINAFRLKKGTTNGAQGQQSQNGQATAADVVRNRQLPPQTATASPGAPGVQSQQQESFFQPVARADDLWAPAQSR